jgi:dTDP-4-amino-4,6-dideoxy-D-galactose acyltransferase
MAVVPLEARIDATRTRQLLSAAIPDSPLAFTRRINVEADRAMLVDRLTQPLPPDADLRFVHEAGGTDVAVFARKLAWDSGFFGYGVARLDGIFSLTSGAAPVDYHSAVTALIDLAAARDVTYLFAAVDARDLATLRALGDAGFALIETRLYYHRDLEHFAHDQRYAVRIATPEDVPLLSAAARDTINAYDRFHADPFITRTQADDMMCRWVEASVCEGFADVTFVPDAPQPKAFCTVRYHKDKWERWGLRLAQPVFSAVAPEFKGWYRKLISEITCHLIEQGAQHAFMTTQSTNSAVVWTWESLGYRYGKAEHILRKITRGSERERRA